MAGLQVRGVNDVQKIIMVYEDFHKVSGLQVNLKKTEMLCIRVHHIFEIEIVNWLVVRKNGEITY